MGFPRRGHTVLLSLAGALGVSLSAGLFTACSSTSEAIATGDAGVDAARPPKTPPATPPPVGTDSGPPVTHDQCLADCETAHPTGLVKDKAIDTCWAANCQGPCVDDTGIFDAGMPDDAGDAGDGGAPACVNPPDEGPTCDACTSAFCCAPWDACFDDKDCFELNTCRAECPP